MGGSYYLQAHSLEWTIFLPALATGLLATAVLNINNLRDIEQDRLVGKQTLAVRLGPHNGRIYHCLLLSLAVICLLFFAINHFQHWLSFAFVLAIPLLFKHGQAVYLSQEPSLLRPMLAQMAMLALLVNLLFSFGLLIG